jgi:hypothetical protein
MSDEIQKLLDQEEIRNVRRMWAYGRDMREWDLLRSVFHPDATVHVSWFKGQATEFVQRSSELAKLTRPGEHNKHWLGNMRTTLRGTRAIQETDIQVLVRAFIGEHLFDNTAWGRFYDRFEKRNGRWKILQMTCIYEKDRLDPVVPGSVPASFFEGLTLTEPGFECSFMKFRLAKLGREGIPVVLSRSEDENRLRSAAEQWLVEG